MSRYHNIRQLRRTINAQDRRLEENRKIIPAVIVTVNGTTSYTQAGQNYTWVNIWNYSGSYYPALNTTGATEAGTPVLIAKQPKSPYSWEIIGINQAYVNHTSPPVGGLTLHNHAPNHQVPTDLTAGIDPVYIFQPAILMLKTRPIAGLIVGVNSYIYRHGGNRVVFNGMQVDLTASVPGAGLTRRVLIYLNRVLNTLGVVEGSTVATGGAPPIPYPSAPVLTPTNSSAYVTLVNGQTNITWADIEHARDFLGGDVNNAFSLPEPTAPGQVLYSIDGVEFQAEQPIIGDDGTWISGDSGILLVEG
jgi:hypothetical protein